MVEYNPNAHKFILIHVSQEEVPLCEHKRSAPLITSDFTVFHCGQIAIGDLELQLYFENRTHFTHYTLTLHCQKALTEESEFYPFLNKKKVVRKK